MKKHTLFILGLLFLAFPVLGQTSDSTARRLTREKMALFTQLLEQLATPGLDMTTRMAIERTLEADFLDNREVYLHQDINHNFGSAQQLSATAYFGQLKALYPLGAALLSSPLESSDIFYNESRDMFYQVFRCKRTFKGINALSKKEVFIEKTIDYQVKISEAGHFGIQIVSGWQAEGGLNTPLGLDKPLSELKPATMGIKQSSIPEEYKLEEARKILQEARNLSKRYQELEEIIAERGETPGERKARKAREKAERARLERELQKAKAERRSLTTNRINIRIGFGFLGADSGLNSLPAHLASQRPRSWVAKGDVQFKFAGINRLPDGKWEKAHTMGLFLNYGQQSRAQTRRLLPEPGVPAEADSTRPNRTFMEGEVGFMLREEFRISGGMGLMDVNTLRDGILSDDKHAYYSFTAGISPRISRFLEMDFNFSGLWINGEFKPRANVNLVLLMKARKR